MTRRAVFPKTILLPAALLQLASLTSTIRAETRMPPTTEESRIHYVTATAYNSVPEQTMGDPWVTASGERLKPGQRVIAVSRDLEAHGLRFGTEVRIEGLPGTYVVSDRTAPRWKQRIDIWMETDLARAKRWGKRTVKILWTARNILKKDLAPPSRQLPSR